MILILIQFERYFFGFDSLGCFFFLDTVFSDFELAPVESFFFEPLTLVCSVSPTLDDVFLESAGVFAFDLFRFFFSLTPSSLFGRGVTTEVDFLEAAFTGPSVDSKIGHSPTKKLLKFAVSSL